jgi:signal transduction histidine kinase
LGRTPLSVRQALWRDRRLLVFGAALLILIVTLISMLVAATLTRPLRRLIAQTARVERGDAAATVPLERPGVREIEQISQAVARLSTTLQQRAEYIATFAANVSHELKTPLTALRGTVELLRDHLESMSVEERERFLSMLEKDTQRVERLGERLLDLARADVIRPGEESVALLPVVETIAERFACQGRRFHFRAEELTGITVRVGCEALDAILANLLDNAFVHGPPGVEVTLRARSVGGDAVAIEVLDDGPGIPEPLRARVFERFVTTRRNDGGTGLGLAIVASLARAHGGDVMLGREARDGRDLTVFSLRLPRA